MNKIKIAILTFFSLALVTAVVPAASLAVPKEDRMEVQADVRGRGGSPPGLLKSIITKLGRAAIISGTLSAKNGTTLTVTKNGKTYTVLTDAKTQLRRRFWGKATLDEMQVGDTLNVHGKWTDDTKTTIQATLVRDLSIQKRFGVFFGSVTSLTSNGWVMQTIKRGSQTVTVSSATKFINRRGETISQSDIAVGHRVRVRGLWDSKANTVTEVTQVKDFSLPPRPTPSK